MSAWCRKTLVGMQPTCRHVPPRNPSFSMTTVFSPHCAARIAVLYPPGPLPIIARSYLAKCPPRQVGVPLIPKNLTQEFGGSAAAVRLVAQQAQSKQNLCGHSAYGFYQPA